jgi:3-oxoacyl-[acyl-carrier-protein] synthase-1
MLTEPAYIVALGASTALGRNALSSAAAVRAGITGHAQHPYMIDLAGKPMIVAPAPWVDIELCGTQRLQALLCPAIDQVLESASAITGMQTALALALPAPRPGLSANFQTELVAVLNERYRGVFAASAVFPHGHAAGLIALQAACRKLAQGTLDACLVAGVDSYIAPETLEWLEACDQVHAAGPLNNAWGFVPGEGAGALLLVRGAIADKFASSILAQVLGVGTATESKRIKTKTVCIGEGLTQAFRGALEALPQGTRISDVYCDMNGEPYRADEYGFTCLRTKEYFESASDFVAPADCWGDVSSASTLLYIGLAAIAGHKGYANGSTALVWASSEHGERGAALLRVSQGPSHAS